jgi:molybdopterin-guanine dinucleotide biosynthesis protein A
MTEAILGVLLAGGRATRMGGGDKGLRELGGITIMARAIARLRPQVADMVINANGDPARLAPFGLPVVTDDVPGFAGPLAGILAGLDAAGARGMAWVVSVPTDCPFLPPDLVARLMAARTRAGLACAASGGQTHPVVGLWPTALRADLRHGLTEERIFRIDRWTARHGVGVAEFAATPWDPFMNVNAPEDLAAAAAVLAQHPQA